MAASAPVLEAKGIVKRFGPLFANEVASNSPSHPGEVVALLGENGAGKSTFCKILYGYYRPDAGEFGIAGRTATIDSPARRAVLGIGMVFQNFSLIPALSVWENVALFLDDLPRVVGPLPLRRRMEAPRRTAASTMSTFACRSAAWRSATSRRSRFSSNCWPARAS